MRTANIRAIEHYIKVVIVRLVFFAVAMLCLGYFFGGA